VTQTEQERNKRSYLNEQPRGDEGQSAVLSVEAVMIRVEREVVQVEEPETANTMVTDNSEDYRLRGGGVLSANSRHNNAVPAKVHIASRFHIPHHATDTDSSFQTQSNQYEAKHQLAQTSGIHASSVLLPPNAFITYCCNRQRLAVHLCCLTTLQ
jgi:hypothetical protein